MNYFARYNPNAGFKVAVDGFHNMPYEGAFIALYCLNPPAALYQDPVFTQDVQFTTKYDFESGAQSPFFVDGFHHYQYIDFDPNMVLVIDIREIQNDKLVPFA